MRVERLGQGVIHGNVVAEASCDYELGRSIELTQAFGGGIEKSILFGIEIPEI